MRISKKNRISLKSQEIKYRLKRRLRKKIRSKRYKITYLKCKQVQQYIKIKKKRHLN